MIITMVLIVLNFIITGMLISAVVTTRSDGRAVPLHLYGFAVLNFVSGLYQLIALVGMQ